MWHLTTTFSFSVCKDEVAGAGKEVLKEGISGIVKAHVDYPNQLDHNWSVCKFINNHAGEVVLF